MSLTCIFGHTWDGCKCSKCGKTRDEGHNWSEDCEKCSVCGKTRTEQHVWSKDCEKCSICGKTRAFAHNFNDCKCTKCGVTRDQDHDWSKDCEKCSICGKILDGQHIWKGCTCEICGKVNENRHDWWNKDRKCVICGATRTEEFRLSPIFEAEIYEMNKIVSEYFLGNLNVITLTDNTDGKVIAHVDPRYGVDYYGSLNDLNNIVCGSGWNVMRHVLQSGETALVKQAIEKGLDFHVLDNENHSALELASMVGNPEVIALLTEYGLDINEVFGERMENALKTAIEFDCPDALIAMLHLGADKEIPSITGNRPIHFAAETNNDAHLRILINAGADLNIRNDLGSTALHQAAEEGLISNVKLLLQAGADTTLTDNLLRSAAQLAKIHGHDDVARIIADHNITTGIKDSNLVQVRLNPSIKDTTYLRSHIIAKILLEANDDKPMFKTCIDFKKVSMTILGEIIQFTGSFEYPAFIRSNDGWTVLHYAISSNDMEFVQQALATGIDIHEVDDKGWGFMHYAAFIGNPELIKLLHEKGVDLNQLTTENHLSPIHLSILSDCPDATIALLELGADKEIESNDMIRPIHFASMKGKEESVKILLDAKIDVNALEVNEGTALHAAAYYGHLGIAKLLLEAGATPDLADLRGNTPYILAKMKGFTQICKLLPTGGHTKNDVQEETIDVESLLEQLEQIAASGQLFISPSQNDHFGGIVEVMELVGAKRHGSKSVRGSDGKQYVMDIYELPSGNTLNAGYQVISDF